MRTLFNILSTVFLSLGAIIGAGFVSGSELVVFFGVGNYLPTLVFSLVLTACCMALVFSFAIRESFNQTTTRLFGKTKFFSLATTLCNLLFFVSTIAGIDAVCKTFVATSGFPYVTILAIVSITFLVRFGVKGLEKFNLFLMPLVVAIVIICVVSASGGNASNSTGGASVINGVLYCFLNTFVAMPVLFETAKGKSRKTLLISAIIICVIVLGLAIIIINAIKKVSGAEFAEMPFCFAVKTSPFSPLLNVAVLIGAITSGASAYYPVYKTIKGRFGVVGIVFLGAFSFLLSRLGLSVIVKYLYPLIAGFGGVFLLKMAIEKFGIKGEKKAHNKAITYKEKRLCLKKEVKKQRW